MNHPKGGDLRHTNTCNAVLLNNQSACNCNGILKQYKTQFVEFDVGNRRVVISLDISKVQEQIPIQISVSENEPIIYFKLED